MATYTPELYGMGQSLRRLAVRRASSSTSARGSCGGPGSRWLPASSGPVSPRLPPGAHHACRGSGMGTSARRSRANGERVMTDHERALHDPRAAFGEPEEVLSHRDLTADR